jgi:hypothetical protein
MNQLEREIENQVKGAKDQTEDIDLRSRVRYFSGLFLINSPINSLHYNSYLPIS